MSDRDHLRTFAILNEVGIIEHLARTILESRLPPGAGAPHFALLNHLIRVRDGRTPLELARAFQVPKTTMSHTVATAAKHGWVTLGPNARDGRSKRVWLTDAGRAMRDGAIRALGPDLDRIGKVMDVAEQEALLARLTELRTFLDAQRDPPNGSDG